MNENFKILLHQGCIDFLRWTPFSEPGYYEDGNFGIRLENVLVVNKADTKFNFGDKGYLSFEHITWVSCYYIEEYCLPIGEGVPLLFHFGFLY